MVLVKNNSFKILILITTVLLFFIISIWSYIQAEISTAIFSSEISNITSLCNSSNKNNNLKYYKIVNYNKSVQTATIYCIYEDSSLNVKLDLNKSDDWRIVFATKLNKEKSYYWPIYI